MAERTCLICAGVLPPRHRSTCGVDCSREASRRRASAWYHERRSDADFRSKRLAQGRAANKRWRDKTPEVQRERLAAYRAANPEAVAEQGRQWRRANPALVLAKTHRRRARLLGAFVADVNPADIWTRDRGICGLCDQPIDPALVWPDRMSKTLDHIVPLARGGTHEPANVQLAHAVCNSRKNSRATPHP